MASLSNTHFRIMMLVCCLRGIQSFGHRATSFVAPPRPPQATSLSTTTFSSSRHITQNPAVLRTAPALHLLKNHHVASSFMSPRSTRNIITSNNSIQIGKGVQQKMSNYIDDDEDDGALYQPNFKRGDKIQVEVIKFGPLGASVDVIAHNSHDPADCIPQDEPALGRGVILQREINYFRRGRGGVDVVKYEILPAFVENVRESTFLDENDEEVMSVRLDVSLRPPGGKAKAMELGEQIIQKLNEAGGSLDVGDKSSPQDIDRVFPGASKGAFKKAVAGLYKKGLVSPGPDSISLM